MKKTFLIFGVIGAIYAIGGYAGDNQSVVVYTCPDECSVNEDVTSCVYSDGSDCGVFATDIFVPQIMGQVSSVTSKSPRNSGSVAAVRSATEPATARVASESATARAAIARPRANTAKPSTKPTGQDKAMGQGGSGYVVINCPKGCSVSCDKIGVCFCQTSDGTLCEEEFVQTGPNSTLDK